MKEVSEQWREHPLTDLWLPPRVLRAPIQSCGDYIWIRLSTSFTWYHMALLEVSPSGVHCRAMGYKAWRVWGKSWGLAYMEKSPANRCAFFPTSRWGPPTCCCSLDWGEETAMCFCLGVTCSIVQVSQLTLFLLCLWNSKHNDFDSLALNLIRQVGKGSGRPDSLVSPPCQSESCCISQVLTAG